MRVRACLLLLVMACRYEKYVDTGKDKEAARSSKGKSKGADAFAETYEEIFSDVMALSEVRRDLLPPPPPPMPCSRCLAARACES